MLLCAQVSLINYLLKFILEFSVHFYNIDIQVPGFFEFGNNFRKTSKKIFS